MPSGDGKDADIGVHFLITPDTTDADILVRWIDHFDFDRAGQTDLTWDQMGRVRKAAISLVTSHQRRVPAAGRRASGGGGS